MVIDIKIPSGFFFVNQLLIELRLIVSHYKQLDEE